jgi:AcrR family transcriptional regulator
MKSSLSAVRRRTVHGEQTRREILKVAVDIASAEGLEGLTIGRLANELEMSKSGLFAHFGSKEELQLAAIETAREIFMQEVVEPALEAEPGLARLYAMLDAWLSYVERSVFRGGCFWAAASAEFDSRPGPVRDQVAALTKAWREAITEEIHQAQTLAQLERAAQPAQLAFELHAFVQEANWAYQLLDEKRAFDRARAAISQRLENLATTRGAKALPGARKARQGKPKRIAKT